MSFTITIIKNKIRKLVTISEFIQISLVRTLKHHFIILLKKVRRNCLIRPGPLQKAENERRHNLNGKWSVFKIKKRFISISAN